MDITLGRFHAQHERPEPLKFAWPIIVLPELFTTTRHLAVLIGYLATIGWEVYAPDVRAAVALAPLVPGFRTPLFMRSRNLAGRRRPINPPRGRTLFQLIADAEPFQRENMIKALVPDSAQIALDVARGEIELAAHPHVAPRLIVAGDSDTFAPVERVATLASAIGAQMVTLRGRGHWIIGGRALERAVAELQRFLVRALGQELLLLYPDEMKE